MALLTIFTTPKPFVHPHIQVIQHNAIRSWVELGNEVEVLVIGEEEGVARAADQLGVKFIPNVRRNDQGTPMIPSIFELARQNSSSPLLAYLNADILVLPDFLQAAQNTLRQANHFLMVGQRWDMDIRTPLDFSTGWQMRMVEKIEKEGSLHPPMGSDYFIFPRDCFTRIPELAVGRAGWDNWMLYEARQRGWKLVDATQDILLVHQNHDYSHLPGGQPHYRLPETFENVRQMGGRQTVFKLFDCSHQLVNGQIWKIPLNRKKLLREVEIFPLVTLRSRTLGWLSYALFHPLKALGEIRNWASTRRKKRLP